jgi:hypothetical protein
VASTRFAQDVETFSTSSDHRKVFENRAMHEIMVASPKVFQLSFLTTKHRPIGLQRFHAGQSTGQNENKLAHKPGSAGQNWAELGKTRRENWLAYLSSEEKKTKHRQWLTN